MNIYKNVFKENLDGFFNKRRLWMVISFYNRSRLLNMYTPCRNSNLYIYLSNTNRITTILCFVITAFKLELNDVFKALLHVLTVTPPPPFTFSFFSYWVIRLFFLVTDTKYMRRCIIRNGWAGRMVEHACDIFALFF